MIRYSSDLSELNLENIKGFFVDWPNPPSAKTHLDLLQKSYTFVVAIDDKSDSVIGFITAVSDGVLSAYIPFLEVLPLYQKKGIGSKLVTIMLEQLKHLYMIDLSCDETLIPFYRKHGFIKGRAMLTRNYQNQAGYQTSD